MTRQPRKGLRRMATPFVLLACALVLASGSAAFAYFSVSANGTAEAQATTLNTPGAGSATNPTTTSLTISWGAATSNPGGYQVLRSAASGGPYTAVMSGTCNQSITETSAATSCIDTGLIPGNTYYYEIVTAYFNGGSLWTSAPTAPFSGTTLKATPTITTQSSVSSVVVGGSVTDQATVSGGSGPTGTITWKVYASTDTSCVSPLLGFSSTQTVNGDSSYTSDSLTVTTGGSYIWGYTYSGDGSNNGSTGCGGTNESFTAAKAIPTLGTSATVSVNVGGTVTDTATLANGYNPTGTITYTLYGPSTTQSCTTSVGVVTSTVTGNGVYTSPSITPPSAGTYWWIANYGGDGAGGNNQATTNTCGDTGESTVVNKVTPTITTTSSSSTVIIGGSISDVATVSNGFSPTGTITWHVYASADTNCTTPLFSYTGTQTVNGNTTYSPSASLTPTNIGTYIWGFTYAPGADLNNNAVSGCGGANESFNVTKATPTISTTASPSSITAGGSAADQANLSGGYGTLGGTISYTLYAPNDTTCSGTPTPLTATGSTVSGMGTYSSGSVQPSVVGTWHWIATYSGDGNNNSVSDPCTGTGSEPLIITIASPTLSVTAPSTGTPGTAMSASSITATLGLSSGSNDTNPITFKVFGPQATAPTTCTAGGTTVGTATPAGNGTYASSAGFTPSTAGNYWWYASSGSDTNNNAAASTCGSGMTETVVANICGTRTFSLPANATVNYTLVGAGGGDGAENSGSGGPGAQITGTLKNTTGSAIGLTINSGCVGGAGTIATGMGTGGGPAGTGYAGGGAGGNAHAASDDGGGGGGGATSVSITSSGTVILVAGGGGGGGGSTRGGSGGLGTVNTGTKSSSSVAVGQVGASPNNDSAGGNGGGGGGGGVATIAAGGAANIAGSGGFSYPATGSTVGGITITVNAPTSGANGGGNGSATL